MEMDEEIYRARIAYVDKIVKQFERLGYLEAIEYNNRLIMRGARALTRQTANQVLRRFLKTTNKPVAEITYRDVEQYILNQRKRGLGDHTLRNIMAVLDNFFKFLYDHPSTGKEQKERIEQILKLLKEKPRPSRFKKLDVVTEEEYEKLLSALDKPRDKAVLAVLYNTGARIGEVLSLKLRNVLYVDNNLVLKFEGRSKTKSHEKIIVLTTARKILEDYINTMGFKDPDDYLFRPSCKNKPLGVFSYGLNLRKARKKAGITKKIHGHLFRHTRATRLARMNISAIEAMQSMGWLSMHMWQHYSHAQPEDTANKIAAIENGGEVKTIQQVQPKYKKCMRCNEDKLPESYLILCVGFKTPHFSVRFPR